MFGASCKSGVIVAGGNIQEQNAAYDYGFNLGIAFQIVDDLMDFNNLPNGLLGLSVKSINKVAISNLVQLQDGLNVAEVNPLIDPEVDDQALLAEFPEISNILNQLVKHPRVADMPIEVDFNSADSVAYHLAGLIPIPWTHKQSLLEAFDATQRFAILSKYIEEISSS